MAPGPMSDEEDRGKRHGEHGGTDIQTDAQTIAQQVTPWPRPALTARKSAPVSPTVVYMILMIQNDSVTSGTLLSQLLGSVMGKLFVLFSCRSERDCCQSDQADLATP